MNASQVNVLLAIIPILVSLLGLGFSAYVFFPRRRWEQKQEHIHIASTQPNPTPTGARWGGNFDTNQVPQRLMPTKVLHNILHNLGMSMPTDVYAVLFPAIVIDSTTKKPVDNNGTYWAGRFDGPLAPGDSKEIDLEQHSFPLTGDQQLIPGYTLSAPPASDPNGFWGHYYFARLTITFRDATGRLLASAFDWESVVEKDVLTQKPAWRVGPIEVTQSLQALIDRTALSRTPPRYQPQGSPISIGSPPSGGAHPVTLTSRLQSLLVSLTPWARRDTTRDA